MNLRVPLSAGNFTFSGPRIVVYFA